MICRQTAKLPRIEKVKIYQESRAPNPRRVRIFLAEKGVDIEYQQVNIMDGDHKKPEFARINPLHRLPVLELGDGTMIAESVSICRYFEELHPEPALMGKTAKEKALIDMYQRQVEFNLLAAIAMCFRHQHPAMAKLEVPQVAEWGKANHDRALSAMIWLNDVLKDREFIAGDTFSIADITALVAIDFRKVMHIEIPDELDLLNGWHKRISGRPSSSA